MTTRKPKQEKIKLLAHKVVHKQPTAMQVTDAAHRLNASEYEDGFSSPELTAWYVKEFCKKNHLKQPEV